MKKIKLFSMGIMALVLAAGLAASPALAIPISFNLGFGGTIEYLGDTNPLTTTDGVVTSVSNNDGDSVSITGGLLNFTTGAGSSADYTYGAGGSLAITGDVGSGEVTLLEASFADTSTFFCCGSGGFATFTGFLDILAVHDSMVTLLGFNPPATGGTIAQVEINVNPVPSGPGGEAFTGTQMAGVVSIQNTDAVCGGFCDTAVVPSPHTKPI